MNKRAKRHVSVERMLSESLAAMLRHLGCTDSIDDICSWLDEYCGKRGPGHVAGYIAMAFESCSGESENDILVHLTASLRGYESGFEDGLCYAREQEARRRG